MKNLAFWTLVGLNAVLVAALATRLLGGGVAVAAGPVVASSRDDYLMMPGEVVGGTNAIVYVLDETTHQLSSMSYDDAMGKLVTMRPRDINRDFDAMGENPGSGGYRRR